MMKLQLQYIAANYGVTLKIDDSNLTLARKLSIFEFLNGITISTELENLS